MNEHFYGFDFDHHHYCYQPPTISQTHWQIYTGEEIVSVYMTEQEREREEKNLFSIVALKKKHNSACFRRRKEIKQRRKTRNESLLGLTVGYWNEYNNHWWWWWERLFPFFSPPPLLRLLFLASPVSNIASILDRCFTYRKKRLQWHGYFLLNNERPPFVIVSHHCHYLDLFPPLFFSIIVFSEKKYIYKKKRRTMKYKTKWSPIECQVELARCWFN